MAGQMLNPKQMQEVKGLEVALNAQQKREGTRHPVFHIIWGCGCCYGPTLIRHRTILTAEEGVKYMRFRKAMANLKRRFAHMPVYKRLYEQLEHDFGMSENVGVQQYSHNHK